MVADDEASRQIWLGANGGLAAARPGAVLVDCSTLSPAWTQILAERSREHGAFFLEAPVTGSKAQAASGALRFLVGGDAHVLDMAMPVLKAMGDNIVHVGGHGSAATLKLINNFVAGVQAAALAEAVVLIERSGLDVERSLQVLTNGAPGSPIVKLLADRMTARDYTVNFSINLMRKDLSYSIDLARAAGTNIDTAKAALVQFDRAIAIGLGQSDIASLLELMRARAHEDPGEAVTALERE